MPTATEKATNGKQNTPLADNEKKKPGLPSVDLTALAGKIDWDKLPEARKVPKSEKDRPKVSEDQVPQKIRDMVEEVLKSEEYGEVPIEDETVRAAFVQFVRAYCYLRTLPELDKENNPTGKRVASRLTSRVTILDDGKTVRYSVSPFKERKSS